MNREKEFIYLTVIIRAFQRLGVEIPNGSILKNVTDTEEKYLELIEESERLSFGDAYSKNNGCEPKEMIGCLLEGIGQEKDVHSTYHISPFCLSLSKRAFPQKDISINKGLDNLRKRMEENIKELQVTNVRILSENLLQILLRYASFIPSSDNVISVYDQTRMAAALAACLFERMDDKDGKDFLLIGADFSGIQGYIYQIVSKYAGKNLKGRSFYLRLLSNAVVSCLLARMGLYQANVIYDSGGTFYLLAPNSKSSREILEDTIAFIEEKIFKAHGTSLFVAIDYVEMSKKELSDSSEQSEITGVWESLFAKRDKKKHRRYEKFMTAGYQEFFCPKDVDGKKRDVLTGADFAPEEKPVKFNDEQFISEVNSLQIKMGQSLRDCDCIIASNNELKYLNGRTHIQPAGLGHYYYLTSIQDIEKHADNLSKDADAIVIKLLNGMQGNLDFTLRQEMTYCPVMLEFYGGNTFNGKTFEEMCDNTGLSRMGVLRMDVDNLGSIFQKGMSHGKASLTRYAALSRSFDFFFSGYINSIILKEEFADKCIIIYSGGDDLFIVGEWDKTIRIAKEIRHDFQEYTCGNPHFSISGGVAILNSKFPIIAGAQESALEEAKAKEHICNGEGKNAISFMDTPLNWKYEFPVVESLKDTLVELLYSRELPKSFLTKVLLHTSMADITHHKIRNVKTYWMMSYDLKRIIERSKTERVKQLALNCQKEIWKNEKHLNGTPVLTDYHPLELWAFACRWAELEYRMLNQ